MKVAFIMNEWAMNRPINPEHLFDDSRGLTGSEISFIMFANELSKLGHSVSLFGNFTHNIINNGCEYFKYENIQQKSQNNWDIAIAWIDPSPLKFFSINTKKIFNQQVNDFHYCQGWENYVNIITSPSETHRDYLKQFSSFDLSKWKILYNGCDPSLYKFNRVRKNKIVFASSPDRALHWVLEAFPKVKKEVPDAELHIYYNFTSIYNQLKNVENEMAQRIKYCKYAIDKMKNKGISHHQSVSRNEMINVMNESKLLMYPCDPVAFTEGFSVTTLEAAVAGCLPIITGADALPEIYGKHVPMVLSPYSQNKDKYLELVIRALKDEQFYQQNQSIAKHLSIKYNWKNLTEKYLSPILNDA